MSMKKQEGYPNTITKNSRADRAQKYDLRQATLADTETIAPYLIANLPVELKGAKILKWGPYAVTRDGRVYSFRTRPGWLKLASNGDYLQVYLTNYQGDMRRWFKIHHLVAHLFVRNKRPGVAVEVHHIDHNKHNNHYKNLRWVTRSENIKLSYSEGGRPRLKTRPGKTLSEESKLKMREAKLGERHPKFKGWYEYDGNRYASLGAVAEAMGVSIPTVARKVSRGLINFVPKGNLLGEATV